MERKVIGWIAAPIVASVIPAMFWAGWATAKTSMVSSAKVFVTETVRAQFQESFDAQNATIEELRLQQNALTSVVGGLSSKLSTILEAQDTESVQSEGEAAVNRRLECKLDRMIDPTSHTEEECEAIQ